MIDIKKPLPEWTTEDLQEHKRRLNCRIEFMFMPPSITPRQIKENNDIINDAEKIRNELTKRSLEEGKNDR